METTRRLWLVLPNGSRQLIDPDQFDLDQLESSARRLGGELVREIVAPAAIIASAGYEPPASAIAPLFRLRLSKIHPCRASYDLDINARATSRVLGGYYKSRRLIRIYLNDRATGRRTLGELFETFLHEVAHHLEYTEPDSFAAERCERVHGRMHSALFFQIFDSLCMRWRELQDGG